MGRADGVDQPRRWRFGNVATGRDDHRVGVGQRLQAVPDTGPEPPADLRVVLAADGEVVPGVGQPPVDAEDLARRGAFEQRGAVGDGQSDAGHVRNCTGYVVADTGRARSHGRR